MQWNRKVPAVIGWLVLIGAGLYTGVLYKMVSNFEVEVSGILTVNAKSIIMDSNQVVIKTNKGDIELMLFGDKAPKTVDNFITLAKDGFYDGTKFHRVIPDFMIQGGDPNSKGDDTSIYGTGGPGYVFDDEINDQKLVRGVLAMANAGPGTNGSQFFIITAASTPWLDGAHTAFGKVIKGMEVVDEISAVERDGRDIPLDPVEVITVQVK